MFKDVKENNFFFFFLPCREARRILVPRPGIEPAPPAVEAQSLNCWTTREVPEKKLIINEQVGNLSRETNYKKRTNSKF